MFPTSQIVSFLDREFRVEEVGDAGIAEFCLTEAGRARATEAFLSEKSGLLFDFAPRINKIYCVVFITTEVLDRLMAIAAGPSLIFTHHPLNYHEDARGFSPFPEGYLTVLEERKIAVYAIHNPLDVGLNISVSKSLAERLNVSNMTSFFEFNGGDVGIIGSLNITDLTSMAGLVCESLGIESVDVFDNGAEEGLTAAVAGGGDQPDILEQAKEKGCTTYITGTVVHRWAFEPVQDKNKKFHALAREWKINLIGASHYHTEKCAVQDASKFLEEHGYKSEFVDDPVLGEYSIGNWKKKQS
ncbi:MAG: Nif3-like dinuclear metal center hexameric protein [Planctomycetota bacterium]|jgi:putative NIF3 family GTP cyclohydrolase 1 type 2